MLCIAISYLVKFYALVDLLGNRFPRSTIRRMESSIVTKRTASTPHRAVTIRTCKTGVYHKLLQTFAIKTPIITDKRIISLTLRKELRHGLIITFHAANLLKSQYLRKIKIMEDLYKLISEANSDRLHRQLEVDCCHRNPSLNVYKNLSLPSCSSTN